jgi:hypothetical protein
LGLAYSLLLVWRRLVVEKTDRSPLGVNWLEELL